MRKHSVRPTSARTTAPECAPRVVSNGKDRQNASTGKAFRQRVEVHDVADQVDDEGIAQSK